jgi:hypothetical protein
MYIQEKHLKYILVVLVIITLLYFFLQTTYYQSLLTIFNINNHNDKLNTTVDNSLEKARKAIIDLTNEKINLVAEKAYIEAFANANANLTGDTSVKDLDSTGFLSKNEKIKLLLFYMPTCRYSIDFMPVWNRVINNLPRNVLYEEIDCIKDKSKPSEYNVTGVPTVILEINTQKFTYVGSKTYNDVKRFLREHSINLVERSFESFGALDESLAPEETNQLSSNCPLVSFDKKVDIANDSYRFQIFSDKGQYGYAEGGNKDDKLLTPFMAAYSVVDSYLSSLPDLNNLDNTTLENVDECAAAYAKDISCFGLCDKKKLDEIASYESDVERGLKDKRIVGIDYTNNKKIVNAIKKACNYSVATEPTEIPITTMAAL